MSIIAATQYSEPKAVRSFECNGISTFNQPNIDTTCSDNKGSTRAYKYMSKSVIESGSKDNDNERAIKGKESSPYQDVAMYG
jgi:hypothetical protein